MKRHNQAKTTSIFAKSGKLSGVVMFTEARRVLSGLLLFSGLVMSVGAAQAAERAVIHFADMGNIRTWHAESADVLFIQDRNRQWYRVTFAPPCLQLPFAIVIGFESDTLGNIDRDGSILVEDERCFFKSIEESSAPVSEKATEGKD